MGPDHLLTVYLQEYDKLKDEQIQRAGFRDNIIYINLVAVGAVGAFAVSQAAPQADSLQALFIIPWVCLVLGWTYLVNDQKISAIGRYLRDDLDARIRACLGVSDPIVLRWELAHRADPDRQQRKRFQLAVDELTFVFSGLAAIVFYWMNQENAWATFNAFNVWTALSLFEGFLLLILAYQIWKYADGPRGYHQHSLNPQA